MYICIYIYIYIYIWVGGIKVCVIAKLSLLESKREFLYILSIFVRVYDIQGV